MHGTHLRIMAAAAWLLHRSDKAFWRVLAVSTTARPNYLHIGHRNGCNAFVACSFEEHSSPANSSASSTAFCIMSTLRVTYAANRTIIDRI
jgi:hypothetical protein